MNNTEFTEAVREMRKLQIRYFKERSGAILSLCKQAERKVDDLLLKSVETTVKQQPKLF
jgi:hypothetical protein